MKTKILFVMLLLLSATLFFSSCNSNDNSSDEENNTNEIYMNQKGSWSNGVEFEILDHRVTSEIESSLVTYTTQNKFIVLKLQVFNGSADAFSADATDVWLTVNGAKIYQQNFVERDVNGFSEINQSPTTTKCYYLVFEVGNDISMDDLKLVIHNGSLLNSEALVIKLKNSPKDCTVTLNYAYERENDTYHFYSGSTIVPSNFPTPARDGYKFCGWYQTNDFSDEVFSNITLEKDQAITLYAKWEESKINITYNGNGNTGGATATQSVQIGTSTMIKENGFTKVGFNFVGWTREIGSNEIITPGSMYNISLNQTDITLYAKWSKEIKTVDDFNTINDNNDAIFVLKNDLDFNGLNAVTIEDFQGVFIGNNHKISNSSSALFIENKGEINGLTIENCVFSCTREISFEFYFSQKITLLGYGGLVAYNSGIISNCYVITSLNQNVENICYGGIVAVDKGGTINNSKVNLDLQSEYICGASFWGGIVGVSLEKTATISNCFVQCKIRFPHSGKGASSLTIGGIMAGTYSSNATIQHCFVDLDMDIAMNYATDRKIYSGVVALCSSSSKIDSCAVIGTVNYPKTMNETVDAISQYARSKSNDNVTNCFADSNLQYNMISGYNVENVETSLFFSKDFYVQKNLLNLYTSKENISQNPNAVWIVIGGELPKLYWE